MLRLKDVRNSLLIALNNSLLSDEELLLLLDEDSSENPQFNHDKYERSNIEEAECKTEFRVEKKCCILYSCLMIIDIELIILSITHPFLKQK